MRYSIRRIGLWPAARAALLLGWLVALPPALCLTGLFVRLVTTIGDYLGTLEPLTLTVFGQDLATIDPLQLLALRSYTEQIEGLAAASAGLFLGLALTLTLLGTAVLVVVAVAVALGYNLLASLGGAIEVELREQGTGQARGNLKSKT